VSIDTTNVYAEVDLETKAQMLSALWIVQCRERSHTPLA